MHKKLLAGACALGFVVPALATQWFDAGIAGYSDWPTDGSDKVVADAGTWSNTDMAGLAGDAAKYLTITNAEEALTFTAETPQTLSAVDAQFSSSVKYTAFEIEDLPEIPEEAKAGLTVAQDGEGALTWRAIRYNGTANEWVVLSSLSAPATTSAYVTVTVKMGSGKVAYFVDGNVLTDQGGTDKFDLPAGADTLSIASYQGVGEVASLAGAYEGAPWGGAGTEESPYLVNDVAGLQAMAEKIAAGKYTDCYFQLNDDVDMTGIAWSGIGTQGNPFTGTLVGSQKISGLSGALFAYADGATIKGLTIEDAPFVGSAAGTITFVSCSALLSAEFEPTYGYAYVLAGATGATVNFEEEEEVANLGPVTLAPVPDSVGLMANLRYGLDLLDGNVQYLVGTSTAEDPIYEALEGEVKGGAFLVLHAVDNDGFTVVDLWEKDQYVTFDTSLADFAENPVGIDSSAAGTLWVAKTVVSENMTTYTATDEEPAPTEYTVSYTVDGKSAGSEQVEEGESPVNYPEPEDRTGYTGAWDADPSSAVITCNTNFTYTYTAIEYAITVNQAGGEGGSASPAVYTISAEATTITLTPPTKTGFNFDGWTLDTELAGVALDGNTITIAAGTVGEISVTATWASATFEVTFVNGANSMITPAAGTSNFVAGTELTITATAVASYAFTNETYEGWTKKSDTELTKDVTITAAVTFTAPDAAEPATVGPQPVNPEDPEVATKVAAEVAKIENDATMQAIIGTDVATYNLYAAWAQTLGDPSAVYTSSTVAESFAFAQDALLDSPVVTLETFGTAEAGEEENQAFAFTFTVKDGVSDVTIDNVVKPAVAKLVKCSSDPTFGEGKALEPTITVNGVVDSVVTVTVELPKTEAKAFMKVGK